MEIIIKMKKKQEIIRDLIVDMRREGGRGAGENEMRSRWRRDRAGRP